jgi:hypothetical protein
MNFIEHGAFGAFGGGASLLFANKGINRMSRKLTTRAARKMAAARQTHGGGRPPKPARCPRCGYLCTSTRRALGHC